MISTVHVIPIDPAGGAAKSRPAPGGVFVPQRNQRATNPQAPEQGAAAKPGWILGTEPLFHPAQAAVLCAALPHSQPLWDECLPAFRKEAGLGSAGYPKLSWCIFLLYKCLTLRRNIVVY